MRTKSFLKKFGAVFLALVMLFAVLPPMPIHATTFSDLPGTHWAYSQIVSLVEQGVINGFPDGTYRPEDAVTREQFARLVVALLDEPSEREDIFEDVPLDRWSNPYITTAVRRGIIFTSEYGEELGANEAITRQEAAVWMVRAIGVFTEGSLDFNDIDEITFTDEIATAVEIGLIMGMPGNLFAPGGTTTRAQAAVLVTRMAAILEDRAWSGEEALHYVFRSGVVVISEPPDYSFVEVHDSIVITIYNANDAVRQLSIGDTFAFEPTQQQTGGLSGHITDITNQGAGMTITADLPESFEEIFYEFHFASEIDLLSYADYIILDERLQGIEGTNIVRNPNDFITIEFNDVAIDVSPEEIEIRELLSISINGSLTLREPTLQVNIGADPWALLPGGNPFIDIRHLVFTAQMEKELVFSLTAGFNDVLTLFKIPIKKFGFGGEIPIGIRLGVEGTISVGVSREMDIEFGIINNSSHNRTISQRPEATIDVSATLTIGANIRIKLRAIFRLYGVQGDFGVAVESGIAMQSLCPQNRCFVINVLPVIRISTVDDIGIGRLDFLQFEVDLLLPDRFYRFSFEGSWHDACPHTRTTDPLAPPPTPPPVTPPPVDPDNLPEFIWIRNRRFSTEDDNLVLWRLEYYGLTCQDIVPLRYMVNLWSLSIAVGNHISDISPLAGLTNLQSLEIGGSQISDISPLDGLTNLNRLRLGGNQITDITPLAGLTNLTELSLQGNQISNISALSGLVNLVNLDLQNNYIRDISPLANLTSLTRVELTQNPVTDWSPVSHVVQVRGRPRP
ncbi:MAG: S-layer homology domain-containing protein [Clostridiales bacterium]|nr:S-layer homology domain-containing protein [Clostridiales bacterium]